jgi:hypothetical protein
MNRNTNRVQYRPPPQTLAALRAIAEVMAQRAPWQGKVSINDAAKYATDLGVDALAKHPDFGPALVNAAKLAD